MSILAKRKLAILVESMPMQFELYWLKGLEVDSIQTKLFTFLFSIFNPGGHFVHRSETVLATLIQCHLRSQGTIKI